MAVYKRKNTKFYQIDITINGIRIRKSTGCFMRRDAKLFEDKLKLEFSTNTDMTNCHFWKDATKRWLIEKEHKRSIKEDLRYINWLSNYLDHYKLTDITTEIIETTLILKEPKTTTINRILSLIKAILNKSYKEWRWIDKMPYIRMRREPKYRDKWLTKEQAEKLAFHLPEHLKDLMLFTLYVGPRASNVLNLTWTQISLTPDKEYMVISYTQFKNANNYGTPLSKKAVEIIKRQLGKHPEYVFTYKNKPIKQCNTRAWRNALKKAGINDFRWHDLRHTWATWFLISGGSLHELMGLGGWKDLKSVIKYAHWANEYLRSATNKLTEVEDTHISTSQLSHS